MEFKPGEIQLDYFDGLGGRNSDLTISWQMMKCSCACLRLCLRCGREEEVSRPRGGALLAWAGIWLQTARWHCYKQDLSSGLNSHVLSLDSTQTLPCFYLEVTECSRSSVMTTQYFFFPPLFKKHRAFIATGQWRKAVSSCECGFGVPWDMSKDLLPWGMLIFTMGLFSWCTEEQKNSHILYWGIKWSSLLWIPYMY